MKRTPLLLVLFALMAVGCNKHRPVKLDRAAAEASVREIEKERADTREWLRSSPTSYLAAVDRIDFNQGHMRTVGRAADNDVRMAATDIEPHHLRVMVEATTFESKA
jgi:hypothetical protein